MKKRNWEKTRHSVTSKRFEKGLEKVVYAVSLAKPSKGLQRKCRKPFKRVDEINPFQGWQKVRIWFTLKPFACTKFTFVFQFLFCKWLARKDNQEVGSCLSVPDRNETEFVSFRIRKNRVPMQNCIAVGDIKAQNNRYTGKKIKSQNMLKYNSHVICQSWKILRHLPIIVFCRSDY